MTWTKFDCNLIGKVIYPFHTSIKHGLKLSLGDTVIIKSKNEDWYYGYSLIKSSTQSSSGIFPSSYVKVIGKDENSSLDQQRIGESTIELLKSRMLNTIVINASMWVSEINAFHQENNMPKFVEAEIHINKLIELFYEISNWSVNKDKLIKYQNQLWAAISKINNILNCDATIKTKNLSFLGIANFPLIQLEQMHIDELSAGDDKRETLISTNSTHMTMKPDQNRCKNLQIIVENFEFFGCSDDIVLEWIIIDIMNELAFEPFWQSFKEVRKGRPPWMGEKFIYKDVPGEIRKEGVYLIVYVYRLGELLTDHNKQLTGIFRRPISFGSSSLKDALSEVDKTIINFYNLNEMDFLKPTKEILRMKFASPVPNRFVQISASILTHTELTADEYDVDHILENIFLRNDVAYESDRHCLYLKMENAEFDRANKTSARNVEAQISIRNLNAEKQACISLNPDKNNKTDYFSSVTYHCNSPRWKDLIKIDLHAINTDDCHILIDFYHCTTNLKKGDERKHFGSVFFRLIDFFQFGVSRKIFTLNTQKISKSTKADPVKYLNGNCVVSPDQEKTSLKENCRISLALCSTHLSINKDINEFLQTPFDQNVPVVQQRQWLKSIQIINTEDFLKPKLRRDFTEKIKYYFLNKIFVSNDTIQIELFITWQIISYKYIKFGLKEELLCHLRSRFQFIDGLLESIQLVLRDIQPTDISYETMVTVFNSMEPIFMTLLTFTEVEHQFQISERIKEILKWNLTFFEGHHIGDSARDIRKLIFDYTIENLKYIENLIPIQLFLEYFKNLFFSTGFLDEKILPDDKLDFILKLLKSGFHVECSTLLFSCFHPIIEICSKLIYTNSPHILQVSEILSNLFNALKQSLQEERVHLFSQKIMRTFFTRSFSAFNALQFKDQQKNKYIARQDTEDPSTVVKNVNNTGNNETVASLECQKMYTLIFAYLEEWCEISNANIELTEFYSILLNLKILLEINVYQKRWLSMHLKISNISERILKKSAEYLQMKNEEAFNKMVPVFFETCYVFIMMDCLQLQNFPLAKVEKITEEYGDMRISVVDCYIQVWKIKPDHLDSFDKAFTVQTTMKILNITFLNVSRIRRKTIPILLHTICNWIQKCDEAIEVNHDFLSETEILLRDGHGDAAYYELLSNLINVGTMDEDISEIMENFAHLLNLHLEYRKLSGIKSNKLHSQFLLHAFMKFYQEQVNIFPHFQHYSLKFSQMLENEENFFEAALVLKLQYDYILRNIEENEIDDIFFENYEGCANEQQKEQLRKRILELLNLTKEYEYSAELCKELYEIYLKSFKYKELGSLLIQWANYYHLIMTEPRLLLNYYRVTFIGGILPSYMKQHRDYILKGSMWFKLSSVKSVLQEAFPDAEIQFYQSTPPVESPYEQNMVIYLAKMEPVPMDIDFRKNRKISTKIRNFYKDHRIIRFISDHPFHKGTIDKENEIKSLNISRVMVMTDTMMPSFFMWNPIVYEERIYLTPIEVAIDTVLNKNQIIRDTIDEYDENPNKDLRPFTMLLTGTLDAGVNGGMPKYIDAFFNERSDQESDINIDHINCFRDVLIDQKNVLNEALILHKKLAPPQIQPMHERLEECFTFLSKTVMDLNVFKKRTFSKMNTLNDVYFGTSDISFDTPSLDNREFSFFREVSMISENQRSCFSEQVNRSSNETTSSGNYDNAPPRQVQSSSDRILFRDTTDSRASIRRKVSSTDDETITKLASEYLMQTGDYSMQKIIPSTSTPNISSKFNSSSADDMKITKVTLPALPPINKEMNSQPNKSKTRPLWKRLTLRKGDRHPDPMTTPDGTKLSLDSKTKPRLAMLNIFEPSN